MLAHAATENDHARFLRFPGQLVESADVAYNVHNQARVLERVKVDHIPKRSICQGRTEHWDIVLNNNPQRSQGTVWQNVC